MKKSILSLSACAIIFTAGVSFAQISTSTTANVRNNMSVGGETGRGVPMIDQKVDPVTDPVLDSKSYGAIQTEEQRENHHDKTKAHIDNKGKLAPVEGDKTKLETSTDVEIKK